MSEDIKSSMLSVSNEQHVLWKKKYPSGYKIIAFSEKKIIHTEQDTLPDDLKIDWKNVSVSVLPANPLTYTEEKLKINVPIISYAPMDMQGLNVSVVISRKKQEVVGLAKFGWHNLMAEIIGDDGDSILCLIGFQ